MPVETSRTNAERGLQSLLYSNFDTLSGAKQIVAVRGEGIRMYDDQGRSYIEGCSGLWCTSLGFGNERLAKAAYGQMMKLSYYHAFAGKTHLPIIDLAEKLVSVAPPHLHKAHFALSGSDANDTAVKMIWYYNNGRGKTAKKKIISRRRGYHGLTLISGSITGFDHNHTGFDLPFNGFLKVDTPDYYHNAQPGETEEAYAARCARELEELILREGPDTVAAIFMDPVMVSAGMHVPPKGYGPAMQKVLRKYDVLLVADEVICGFGRTGNYWGSQTIEIEPDIITCAKGISSGYVPISALLLSKAITDGIEQYAHKLGYFAHGFTYAGHPVAAAVALETLKIYDEMDIVKHVRRLGDHLRRGLEQRFASHPLIGDIRTAGLTACIEIVEDKATHRNFPPDRKLAPRMFQICQENGLITRPGPNDTISICPPFIITTAEIDEVLGIMLRSLDTLAQQIATGH
jgi:4-aminobutyrate--pyruvate transaminase